MSSSMYLHVRKYLGHSWCQGMSGLPPHSRHPSPQAGSTTNLMLWPLSAPWTLSSPGGEGWLNSTARFRSLEFRSSSKLCPAQHSPCLPFVSGHLLSAWFSSTEVTYQLGPGPPWGSLWISVPSSTLLLGWVPVGRMHPSLLFSAIASVLPSEKVVWAQNDLWLWGESS